MKSDGQMQDDDDEMEPTIVLGGKLYRISAVKSVIRREIHKYEVVGSTTSRASWSHRRIAYRIAQWFSAEIANQVDEILDELAHNGYVDLRNRDVKRVQEEAEEKILMIEEKHDEMKTKLMDLTRANTETVHSLAQSQNRLVQMIPRVVHQVQHQLNQNVGVLRIERDREYRIIHRQDVSYKRAISAITETDGVLVAEKRNIACGLKAINKIREYGQKRDSPYVMRNSKITLKNNDDDPEYEGDSWTEDDLLDFIKDTIEKTIEEEEE